jgi:pyruvate-formate lyase-activating enzyme
MISNPLKDRKLDMKIYHMVYEPSFDSITFHHWTDCNLQCRGCYCNYEKLDFSLLDNWLEDLKQKVKESPPERFLSLVEVMTRVRKLTIKRAVFIGTEPTLDPDLPDLARALHEEHGSYNVLLTNGQRLIDLTHVDEIILSIKAVSPDIYKEYTSGDNSKSLANFKAIHRMGKRLQTEVLLIPGLIDAEEIEKVAQFIASVDPFITLRIDGYFPLNGLGYRGATSEDVERAASLARKHLVKVNYLTSNMERIGKKAIRVF